MGKLLPLAEYRSDEDSSPEKAGRIIFSSSEPNQFINHRDCAICKSDFSDREKVRRLPCGHVFHYACVDRWLLGSVHAPTIFTNCCPLCKQVVQLPEKRS